MKIIEDTRIARRTFSCRIFDIAMHRSLAKTRLFPLLQKNSAESDHNFLSDFADKQTDTSENVAFFYGEGKIVKAVRN